jgi:hypothetical protein
MRLDNGDGTWTFGPLDIICILKHVETGRFHVAIFEERPMPGPVPNVSDMKFIRLKNGMHHTTGAETLEGSLAQMAELRSKAKFLETNVATKPLPWDGDQAMVWFVSNWTLTSRPLDEILQECIGTGFEQTAARE